MVKEVKNKDYDAFLSYNSQDKSVVIEIADWLKNKGNLSIFFDEWDIRPGERVQEVLEKALDQSKCFVFFLGPGGSGPWHAAEMRAAVEKEISDEKFCLILVVLPGGNDKDIPPFLRNFSRLKFKDKWYEKEVLERLIWGITGNEPSRKKSVHQEDICPYRGLEVFEEIHKDIFFGRDNLINRLMDKFNESSFLAVVGPSGCGKSSVVNIWGRCL